MESPKHSTARIKFQEMLIISNLKLFQSSSKKKIILPNLKEFNTAIVKLVEEVFITGSYCRITVRQD